MTSDIEWQMQIAKCESTGKVFNDPVITDMCIANVQNSYKQEIAEKYKQEHPMTAYQFVTWSIESTNAAGSPKFKDFATQNPAGAAVLVFSALVSFVLVMNIWDWVTRPYVSDWGAK